MENNRIDQEWLVVSMARELIKIASKGNDEKSTYKNAIAFAGELYPDLLGESSLLRRQDESITTKEYRQKADMKSRKEGKNVSALKLVQDDIEELKGLIKVSRISVQDVHLLQKKLSQLTKAKRELDPESHTEGQLIFRDSHVINKNLPGLGTGKAYRDFELADDKILRMRVFHPDKMEHISGADFIYERFNKKTRKVNIILVQYKIWEDREMYVSDERMQKQLNRMKCFSCDNKLCNSRQQDNKYRFPCCTSFLRPTDKLQNPEQTFMSTGEHIPICKINDYKSKGKYGADVLKYKDIKEISLASDLFQELFNRGKIGSCEMDHEELQELYEKTNLMKSDDTLLFYAQEF